MATSSAVPSPRSAPRRALWTLGGMALALIVLAGVWYVLPVEQWLLAVSRWVRDFGPLAGAVFSLGFVAAVLAMFPASLLYLLAGLLFDLGWGVLISLAAGTLGSVLQFVIARYLARARVERLVGRRRKWQALDGAVREEGWKIVLLLRLAPLVPGNLQGYLFGTTPVALRHYAWATLLGTVPWVLLFVWLGTVSSAFLHRGTEEALGPWQWVIVAGGVVVLGGVIWLIARRARARLQAMGLAGDDPAPAG